MNHLEALGRYKDYILSGYVPSKTFWPLNIYGQGFELRERVGLRQALNVRVASDHGVHFSSQPSEWENAAPGALYLTWSTWRKDMSLERSNARVIQVPHPWLHLGSLNPSNLGASRGTGLLVFIPHSTPSGGPNPETPDIYELAQTITDLPESREGVTYMFHWHDRNGPEINTLRSLGKKLISAGDTQSPYFARRFRNIIRRFKTACSTSVGSQVVLTPLFGVDHFILPMTASDFTFNSHENSERDRQARICAVESIFSYEELRSRPHDKLDLMIETLGANTKYSPELVVELQNASRFPKAWTLGS